MPRLLKGDMSTNQVGSFAYSAIRPDKLTATEYTLVDIHVDRSSSVTGFEPAINDVLKTVLKSCKRSPRAENLLVRLTTFGSDITEEHGFQPLSSIDPDSYKPFQAGGSTKLRDTIFSGAVAVHGYGKTLMDNNFLVNAVSFYLTDGEDVGSKMPVKAIRDELERVKKSEDIESHNTILIGFNATTCKQYLDDLKNAAGLTSFQDAGQVTEDNLAKLAKFISQSISSQSSSLGTGGPSAPLTI